MSLVPNKQMNNRVVINVGGTRFETYRSTLKNIPDTRLSWITETTVQTPDCDNVKGEYYFDRHPGVFNMILNYYRIGKLHAPTDVCGPMFEEELAFWGIDEKQIEPCCWSTYRAHRDAQETLAKFDGVDFTDGADDDTEISEEIAMRFGIVEEVKLSEKSIWVRWKPKIWNLLEEPNSSKAAKVVAIISLVFVLFSIGAFCLETHLQFRVLKNPNRTITEKTTVLETQQLTRPYLFLDVVEYTCIAYFSCEIIARFIFCPSKLNYVKQALNWVDFFSIIPFYSKIIVVHFDPALEDSTGLYYLNALRLVRIFRILKLTRHFSGLKILAQTIKASAKELMLLILVLAIGVLIFACLIYYAEQVDENIHNDFRNIPRGFWWAVVTMTTLGYGDIYPRTVLGYIIGAVCALCGLLMLALPVPVIVNNFTLYYSHAQARIKLPKKTKNIMVGAADELKQQRSTSIQDVFSTAGEVNYPDDNRKSSTDSVLRSEENVKNLGKYISFVS
ncbi:potassium voltage-gated channel protein Shaw-like [Patella vulgata]|uniref:potassium voltage-gated channel protein Shaw-like n=1 Tax=Patella vulgata TaxID=6465 RepID=UPI00217FD12B|nr:potassium voltage-gated channel protein Shaw-like [Patella vulgata]